MDRPRRYLRLAKPKPQPLPAGFDAPAMLGIVDARNAEVLDRLKDYLETETTTALRYAPPAESRQMRRARLKLTEDTPGRLLNEALADIRKRRSRLLKMARAGKI